MQDKTHISEPRPGRRSRPEHRVLDENNHVLDLATNVGKIGRLGRGGSVPVGYYKDEKKSAETFLVVDGMRISVPGDFARIEEDGKVTLLGRGSNCVNTGGEKVYPEEVEMAIKRHPAVYDALVVGIPDEKFGQAVAALIQPREGEPLELEELRDYLREFLSGYKLPRAMTLVPRDPAQCHRQGPLPPCQGARARGPALQKGPTPDAH